MNRFFYTRLALSSIKKNGSIYRPYLLAASLIVALFYSLLSVSIMAEQSNAEGGGTMGILLKMSSFVCALLSLAILFYINGFIMKRRKSEFGLYSILGMEKRHIARVMACEVIITGITAIICGVLCGALFSQLFFMLLLRIVGMPVALSFQIPFSAVLASVVLFGAGFILVLLYNIKGILRGSPIELLKSTKEGEREPKSRWIMALVGAAALLGGYALALSVKSPSDVVYVFLFTVLLVIIGTYCLFTAGSIVCLKLMRKNKSFYYKPKNFISVSGMLYRMKQNATGLANICILSTCVLVTLSSTVCLFIGQEDNLQRSFPREIEVACIVEDEQGGVLLRQAAMHHAEDYGITIENEISYFLMEFPAKKTESGFVPAEKYGSDERNLIVMPLNDYNSIMGTAKTLLPGEALLAVEGEPLPEEKIILNGQSYKVTERIGTPKDINAGYIINGITVIVPELSDMMRIGENINRGIYCFYKYDAAGEPANIEEYYGTMYDSLSRTADRLSGVSNIEKARNNFYQMYGSLMFVGLFFVSLFLIATVLIIYYKQITEGFDDRARFKIMQNVGMSDKEVRGTISKQVLIVFFLPLCTAILHIAVAFPVLCKLLVMFNMYDKGLFLLCTLGVVLVFTAFYLLIYRLTARTYYRLVRQKN